MGDGNNLSVALCRVSGHCRVWAQISRLYLAHSIRADICLGLRCESLSHTQSWRGLERTSSLGGMDGDLEWSSGCLDGLLHGLPSGLRNCAVHCGGKCLCGDWNLSDRRAGRHALRHSRHEIALVSYGVCQRSILWTSAHASRQQASADFAFPRFGCLYVCHHAHWTCVDLFFNPLLFQKDGYERNCNRRGLVQQREALLYTPDRHVLLRYPVTVQVVLYTPF